MRFASYLSVSMKFCWLTLIYVFLHSSFAREVNAADNASKQPNVIIIMADDMGFDDVSFRGSKEFLTPNIDAMAYHGKMLDRHYTPPMCTPSRSAVLTGRYPIHTGMQHFVISNGEPWALPTNVSTIAEVFKKSGYSTNLVGKWHLGFAKPEHTPIYRGFDYHYGYWGGYIDYYQRRVQIPMTNFTMGYDFRRNLDLECALMGTYITDLLTNEAERVILSNKGEKPLFLMINHLAPHAANDDDPLQAPPEEVEKFSYIKDPNRRKYAAMVSKLDQSIGRTFQALERAKMLDNSIVIFFSDNGAPSLGLLSNTGSNWPFRGQKNTPWEGSIRVPAAIWSPLILNRGTIFRQPIYVADWLPTLAAAAGISLEPDLGLDGLNLWSELVGATDEILKREVVHFLDDVFNVTSYMQGQWKYIKGSTNNGQYDNVLTFRELSDIDPRDRHYATEVRNSLTSKILHKFDEHRLTKHRIGNLRRDASVNCGKLKRTCNTLIEECLFNIELDPCEENNLRYEEEYQQILELMRAQVAKYRESAWPIRNRSGRSEYDPSHHDCAWTNFKVDPPSTDILNCGYHGLPCETDL